MNNNEREIFAEVQSLTLATIAAAVSDSLGMPHGIPSDRWLEGRLEARLEDILSMYQIDPQSPTTELVRQRLKAFLRYVRTLHPSDQP